MDDLVPLRNYILEISDWFNWFSFDKKNHLTVKNVMDLFGGTELIKWQMIKPFENVYSDKGKVFYDSFTTPLSTF